MLFRKKDVLLTMILFALFTLSSCSKKSDIKNDQDDKVKAEEQISDSNFTETNEDLLTVDYKQFYDELAPHGEWVQVNAKDLGIDLEKGEGAGESDESGFLLNDLFGIKSAYADDFNVGMFFVWRPSPNLAISLVAGDAPVFVPYSNGQWIYTDAGWYFRAPTPYEEITYHYGRWVFDPFLGWVWVPGRVWAPAWVEWRVSDAYIGWAPLPPTVYIVNNVISPYVIHEDHFIFVENRYFCEPSVYKHSFFYKGNEHRMKFKEMGRLDGVMISDNRVINRGPEVGHIEKVSGKKFDPVKINKVNDMHNTKYAGGEMNSYSPHFSKTRETDRKETVSKPNNFVSYDNAGSKEKKSDNMNPEKNAGSNEQGDNKSNRNDGYNKDNKGNKEYNKQGNDRSTKKYDGSNEQKSNDKGNRQKDYKQKENDKGSNQKDNKQKGNDKGDNQKDYKQKGNDKGNDQKDNKQKGNDKGKQKQFRQNSNDKWNNQKDYTPKSNDKGNERKQFRSKDKGRYFNNAPTQKNDTKQRDNQSKRYTRDKNKQSNNDYGSSGNEKSYDKSQGNEHGKRKR
jgi:hypothetical protein